MVDIRRSKRPLRGDRQGLQGPAPTGARRGDQRRWARVGFLWHLGKEPMGVAHDSPLCHGLQGNRNRLLRLHGRLLGRLLPEIDAT